MLKRFTETENICWGNKRESLISPAHWHSYFEIEFLTEGIAQQLVNGNNYNIDDGTVTLLSPNDFHSISSKNNKALKLSVCCIKEDELTSDIIKLLKLYPPPYIIKLRNEAINKFKSTYEIFLDAYNKKDITSAKLAALLIISFCIDEIKNSNVQKTEPSSTNSQIKTVRHIIAYIKENYNKNLTRDFLAEEFHFSPNHLSKIFKNVTGISLFEHIINVRIDQSLILLKTTEIPISKIISMVGYNSPSLFYKHFFNRLGITPNKIKKSSR